MENATCDEEEHKRNMHQWDEAIKAVTRFTSPLPQDDHIGVHFPEQSHACVNQYGILYADKYEQVLYILINMFSDGSQGEDNSDHSYGHTRLRRGTSNDVICNVCRCQNGKNCDLCCHFTIHVIVDK